MFLEIAFSTNIELEKLSFHRLKIRPTVWILEQKKTFLFLAISSLNFHILKTWQKLEYTLVFILVIKKKT